MKIKLISAPSVEPITTAQAKSHLNITVSDDDTYIDLLITAAREHIENYLNRKLITQTWDIWFNSWPDEDFIMLPFGNLQSVSTFAYDDSDGDTTALVENTDFVVDADSTMGRVVLEYGESWPGDTLHPKNPINIRFICGYGDAGSDIPEAIKHAMKLLISELYEQREITEIMHRTGGIMRTELMAFDSLLSSYRLFPFESFEGED